ncbi:hypothetical protein KXD93_28445 [Mucilaginibacter sp. BJC16-A38]|uniref:hypothetical protein n=1 Tax=Mucilaginibacter phenanthrenivorans TaxID=1234842 RepID=UPI0021583C41|nr:hypothetical protein [Mucilaginibacter phenanthrenivorans]MCR8561618.1 hypothetical protein [Mucilaginibacter phenanthrenivorans]
MKRYAAILLLIVFGCKSHNSSLVTGHITLTNNNHAIKFTGLDYAIVNEIGRDSVPGVWQTLLPVYKMPADTDLKNYQPIQHGTYTLKDSAVVFTPDTPFVKGKTYFMRYYQFKGENIWDYIKGKKRLGEAGYRDLVVKL